MLLMPFHFSVRTYSENEKTVITFVYFFVISIRKQIFYFFAATIRASGFI